MSDIFLTNASRSKLHTHTTKDTGQAVTGVVAFQKGSSVWIVGLDTWFSADITKALVETANIAKIPVGVPMLYQFAPDANTLWINASTGGLVSVIQAN